RNLGRPILAVTQTWGAVVRAFHSPRFVCTHGIPLRGAVMVLRIRRFLCWQRMAVALGIITLGLTVVNAQGIVFPNPSIRGTRPVRLTTLSPRLPAYAQNVADIYINKPA